MSVFFLFSYILNNKVIKLKKNHCLYLFVFHFILYLFVFHFIFYLFIYSILYVYIYIF